MGVRAKRQLSFEDARRARSSGHGGRRKGAGRKSSRSDGRSCDPKRRRVRFRGRRAVHVTVRVCGGVPSIRHAPLMRRIRASLLAVKKARRDFGVIHYSVQHDHIHLIVEAQDHEALGRGMKAVGIRVAKAVQAVFGVKGQVFETGHHAQHLMNDLQIYNALRYVLLNTRKHTRGRSRPQVDFFSSMRWFEGFAGARMVADRSGEPEVSRPFVRALLSCWRRHGRIDPAYVPAMG